MPEKRPFLLYLRSRLNFTVAGAAAVLLVLSALFLGRWMALAAPLIAALYALFTFLLFNSKKGASQIVEESERDRVVKVRAKIAAAAALRERISVMRVADEGMRKSLEYFLLSSGTYLQKCREVDLYSPRANARIEDALSVLQAFLGEIDQSSTDRRYGIQEGESAQDFSARCMEAVRDAAKDITEWTTQDITGISGRDSVEILEELEGDK